jgi:hypothetical protein
MIVHLPAGTGTDILARTLAQALDARFGQRFLVVNREGNGVMVAANALASAPADGHTVAILPSTIMTVQIHREKQNVYNRNTFLGVCQTFDNVRSSASRLSQFNDSPRCSPCQGESGKLRFATSASPRRRSPARAVPGRGAGRDVPTAARPRTSPTCSLASRFGGERT